MRQRYFQWMGAVSFLYVLTSAISPNSASAEVPLTRASVESLHNHVELLHQTESARPARITDWLDAGDVIYTAADARADLRFNDGSFARIGEQATFRFTPNTRTFHLAHGTALLLVPPEQGVSTIETPNAITQFHETALVVRYISAGADGQPPNRLHSVQGGNEISGRTVVIVLTDQPEEPVEVSLFDGRMTELAAGQMAIVDGNELFVFEFDLALFYETSTLVENLHLDDPYFLDSGEPTDPVRQETLEGLVNQRSFEGEYLLDPDFLNSEVAAAEPEADWLVPLSAGNAFSGSSHESKPSLEAIFPLLDKACPEPEINEQDETVAVDDSGQNAVDIDVVSEKTCFEAAVDDGGDLTPDNISEDPTAVDVDVLPPLVNSPADLNSSDPVLVEPSPSDPVLVEPPPSDSVPV
ncbi:MAG: FecR domain-containing protein, partial [Cyanobacteria bacterium P01_F01_bin.86]